MKTIFNTLLIVGVMFCSTSCGTYTKLSITGEPGTEILTPGQRRLATINASGRAKINNPDGDYYAFLISHKPGTNEYIPFALDYREKEYAGAAFGKFGGAVIGLAGLSAAGIGLLGEKEALIPGVAGLVAGGILYGTANERTAQVNHQYCFQYLHYQKTNQDIKFTMPLLESATIEKNTSNHSANQSFMSRNSAPGSIGVSSASDGASESATVSRSNRTLASSTSKKTLKDNAKKIEGTYIGSGSLMQGQEIIEDYSDIKVTLKRKSDDVVLVNVIESGSNFFTSDGEYTIHKRNDGKYTLMLKGIRNATIEINTNNNLIYLHPRVNIDGTIYTLSIKAVKE